MIMNCARFALWRLDRLGALIGLAVLGLWSAGCSDGNSNAGPVNPPSANAIDRIYFVSNRTNTQAPLIFSMAPDGSDVTQLALFNGINANLLGDLSFSADGSKILASYDFGTGAGTQLDISTPNGAATNLMPIVGLANGFGAISPDGSRIAYAKYVNSPVSYTLNIANTDGSGITTRYSTTTLSQAPNLLGFGTDNATLYFYTQAFSGATTTTTYYRLDAGSSTPVAITNLSGLAGHAELSGDGAFLVAPRFDTGVGRIVRVAVDGSGETPLTTGAANDTNPVFSHDKTKIYFVSDRDGNREIYSMNPDGSNIARLTFNASVDNNPDTRAPRHDAGLRLIH